VDGRTAEDLLQSQVKEHLSHDVVDQALDAHKAAAE